MYSYQGHLQKFKNIGKNKEGDSNKFGLLWI